MVAAMRCVLVVIRHVSAKDMPVIKTDGGLSKSDGASSESDGGFITQDMPFLPTDGASSKSDRGLITQDMPSIPTDRGTSKSDGGLIPKNRPLIKADSDLSARNGAFSTHSAGSSGASRAGTTERDSPLLARGSLSDGVQRIFWAPVMSMIPAAWSPFMIT